MNPSPETRAHGSPGPAPMMLILADRPGRREGSHADRRGASGLASPAHNAGADNWPTADAVQARCPLRGGGPAVVHQHPLLGLEDGCRDDRDRGYSEGIGRGAVDWPEVCIIDRRQGHGRAPDIRRGPRDMTGCGNCANWLRANSISAEYSLG